MRRLLPLIFIAMSTVLSACVAPVAWTPVTPDAPPDTAPNAAPNAALSAQASHSVEGRVIRVLDLSNSAARQRSTSPRVLIIGSIHGDEPEALAALPALKASLINQRLTIRLIEDLNPDGTIRATRYNARGVDLNRNWPTANFTPRARHGTRPLSEPETRFAHDHITRFHPDAILVLHSARTGPFVNFDGPAEHMANAFAMAAQATDPRWHVRASMGYPTPGSLGTWAGVENHIPILTIEFARGHDPLLAQRAVIDGTLATLKTLTEPPAPATSHPAQPKPAP